MIQQFTKLNQGVNSIRDFTDCVSQGIPLAVFGVTDAFKDYLVSCVKDRVLYIVNDLITANRAYQSITQLTDKKVVILPPKDELLLIAHAFSKDGLYARLNATAKIKDADVVIATSQALMQTFCVELECIYFEKNQEVSQKELVQKLVEYGYIRVESVETVGTFSVRGDIIDVYPINLDNPIRIDFFGDTVESIRTFDAESRKNTGYIDNASILQAVEKVFSKEQKLKLLEQIKLELAKASREQKVNLKVLALDIESDLENNDFACLTPCTCLEKQACHLDKIFSKDFVVVFDEGKRVYDTATLIQTEFTERFNSLWKEGQAFEFFKNQQLDVEDFKGLLNGYRQVTLQTLSGANGFFNPLKVINPVVSGIANYRLDFKELFSDVRNWIKSDYTVYLFAGDLNKAEKLSFDLYSNGITATIDTQDNQGVVVFTSQLNQGFIFHEEKTVVIGNSNLFVKPTATRKIKSKKSNFFSAPEAGDYCVHEIHGIGRVLGSKKITSTEGTKDYIAVEYHGGDILYVPVEQMDILSRYLGGDGKPRLSKIGGKDFERIKKNARESIKKMSFDLKRLYEERNQTVGYKYTVDGELQNLFESAFTFQDTPDQTQATEEIIKDMASGRVMDRLLCGDVGFGKTEMAFRAAFLAIANGKQVCMLAPTTILTEQHYNTAIERFKNFGVKIECLNRFKSAKAQKEIIEKAKNGEIDLCIGTHRLLSKDVAFKDLGLLILDEEQRFGVEHKEKIKLLKTNVDTLTLSATPIPRTLHMALSGIRSISTLNTPPAKRLPVQTYVTEETDMLIKDAVTREINRGGQVFLLYNRVDSIFTFAKHVQDILPNAKITIVHGQMEEKVMEANVLNFYRGESDVLISTTIIENGIDLPKANTLIVIDADKLGLSTLYQLKGRVGRSDRLAYAYFTFKREKILSKTAYDRLNAIIEFTEMGSGIKIAMRDLEIRGAGNVLGAEQHGHMDKIGYELYSKLLKEELTGKEERLLELDVRVTAYIPDEYVGSNSARMEIYKEIAEISNLTEENGVIEELCNEYGELPLEVENLINIASTKYLASAIGAKKIIVTKKLVSIEFYEFEAFRNQKLVNAIDKFNKRVTISMAESPTLNFIIDKPSNAEMLDVIKEFLVLTV